MPISYDVNLTIESYIGSFRPDGVARGGYSAPRPIQQTIRTLEGDVYAPYGINVDFRTMYVEPLEDFFIRPGNNSEIQTLRVSNFGTTSLNVTNILCQDNGVTPVLNGIPFNGYFPPASANYTATVVPGSTATFDIQFYGEVEGEYINSIIIVSDADNPYTRLYTRQIVSRAFRFTTDPTSVTTYVNYPSERESTIINLIPDQGYVSTINTTIIGPTAWKVDALTTETVTVTFDANEISQTTGTVSAQLVIVANTYSQVVPLTAILDIDPNAYKNYGSWLGPASYDNSVIGVSYDKINNRRTVTIGVGVGGNGLPEYVNGGWDYISIDGLGLAGSNARDPYPFWKNVFRIPVNADNDGQPRTYASNGNLEIQKSFVSANGRTITLNDTSNLFIGMVLSGTGFTSGQKITAINNSTQIRIDRLADTDPAGDLTFTLDYQVKVTGTNYASYFGDYFSEGAMFIVEDDGAGNVEIKLNHLREISEDASINRTLTNLINGFHYYSEGDDPTRFANLEGPLPDGVTTRLFTGFYNNGHVVTRIVPIPRI